MGAHKMNVANPCKSSDHVTRYVGLTLTLLTRSNFPPREPLSNLLDRIKSENAHLVLTRKVSRFRTSFRSIVFCPQPGLVVSFQHSITLLFYFLVKYYSTTPHPLHPFLDPLLPSLLFTSPCAVNPNDPPTSPRNVRPKETRRAETK